MRVTAPRITACTIGAALLLLTGCSSEKDGDDLQTIEPATAAVAPAAATPSGSVESLGRPVDALAFDPATRHHGDSHDGGANLLLRGAGGRAPSRSTAGPST